MTGSKKRIPFWGTVFTVFGVIILCALGTWQLQRLAWKLDIIEGLEAAYDSESGAAVFAQGFTGGAFIYGTVEGKLMPSKLIKLGPRTGGGTISYDVLVPLEMGDQVLFVNLGINPEPYKKLNLSAFEGKKVSFDGLARVPDWNSFTPDNEPQNDRWYKPDLKEMAEVRTLENPLPHLFYAESASVDLGPFPNNQRWMPKNNHMQYALFWFSMAGALIVIYILRFIRRT